MNFNNHGNSGGQTEDTIAADLEERGTGTKTQRRTESNRKRIRGSTYLQAAVSQKGYKEHWLETRRSSE